MKAYTDYLVFNTEKKIQFVHIMINLEKAVSTSGVQEGLMLVTPMHVTSAVIINDNEQGLMQDYLNVLERLVPYKAKYKHNVGEDNGAAHIWRQLMGHQVVIPITKGKMDLGPWEQPFYCEFDGQRQKRVLVKIIGE